MSERSEARGCEWGAGRRALGGGPGLQPPGPAAPGSAPRGFLLTHAPPSSAPPPAPPAPWIRARRCGLCLPNAQFHLKTHTKPHCPHGALNNLSLPVL